jgi:hypothetical protein
MYAPAKVTVAIPFIVWFFRVYCEGIFTTETPSSQSSEYFLIKNALLRALRASAVQSPSPYAEIALPGLTIRKPEDPIVLSP